MTEHSLLFYREDRGDGNKYVFVKENGLGDVIILEPNDTVSELQNRL